jgi:hypothetical protein
VAAVGDQSPRPLPWSAHFAAHRWDALDQRHELGDVVAVAAADSPRQRDPAGVYEKVMLGAVSGSINRARARRGAPYMKGAGGANGGLGVLGVGDVVVGDRGGPAL